MIEKKPSRWGLLSRQASVLGRFKNKLRLKKLEWKRFYEQFWGPAPPNPASQDDFNEWPDSCYSTEGSHTSKNNSLHLDSSSSEDYWALFRQEQIENPPPFQLGDRSFVPEICPVVPSTFQQDSGMYAQSEQFHLTQGRGDFVTTALPGSPVVGTTEASLNGQQQLPTPRLDHTNSFDSNPLSVDDYAETENDAISEWLQLDLPKSEQQGSSHLNTDIMRSMNTRYSGEASTMPLTPEARLQWFKQFFELGAEEALTRPHQASTELGWRVMVRIVCACRKLSRLIRRRRVDEIPPVRVLVYIPSVYHLRISCRMLTPPFNRLLQGRAIVRKRNRGFGENRSQLYRGVRRRNGKWVSEIRVGQTNEKVWLGSFDTEKEAALAFDAGKYHCSSQRRCSYNFPESPLLLGPPVNIHELSPADRKRTIQKLAEDHVKACTSDQIRSTN